MLLLELLLISLIILTILTQNLNIRLYDRGGLYLSLSLTIFSLELALSGNKKGERKKARTSIGGRIEYYSLLKRLITRTIEAADVKVYRLDVYEDIPTSIPRLIGVAISTPMLLAYIKGLSHSFTIEDDGALGERIDISFDIPLILVIISFIKLQYYKVRLSLKERSKNAR